jgi:glutamate synthase domain-containing protein 3
MSLKSKISYSIIEGKLKGKKNETLKERMFKNKNKKIMAHVVQIKETITEPIYKTQSWYKKKTLEQRRKYNKSIKSIKPKGKGNFLSIYRESLQRGTRLNVVPNVNLNSPLYDPRKTK